MLGNSVRTRTACCVRNGDGINRHRIDIDVVPVAAVFINPNAIDKDTGAAVSPFFKVAVIKGLRHTHIHHAVVGAAPPVARRDAQRSSHSGSRVNVVDVADHPGAAVAEARVGSGDMVHHVSHSGGTVPAVTPCQCSIGPVHGHDGLVGTSAHPEENIAKGDSRFLGSRIDRTRRCAHRHNRGLPSITHCHPITRITCHSGAVGITHFDEVALRDIHLRIAEVSQSTVHIVHDETGAGLCHGKVIVRILIGDIIDDTTAAGIVETAVIGGNRVHHSLHGGAGAVEAHTPSQSHFRTAPVAGENHFRDAGTHPVGDCVSRNGGIFGIGDDGRGGRVGHGDGRDGHRIDIGVAPAPSIPVGAVHHDAGGGISPLLEVAVDEGLGRAGVHDAVVLAFPVVAGSDAQRSGHASGRVNVVDVTDQTGAAVAETRVGGGDASHHVGHSGGAVPTVTPSQSGVGPVHSHDSLVGTGTHPEENVISSDVRLVGNRNYGRGIDNGQCNGKIVDAAVTVAGTSGAGRGAGDIPHKRETCSSRHVGILAEMDGIVMQDFVVGSICFKSHKVGGVIHNVTHHEMRIGIRNVGAMIEGEHRLGEGRVESGQHRIATGTRGQHIVDMARVAAGVNLAGNEGEESVVGLDGTEAVGTRGITHAAEIVRRGG